MARLSDAEHAPVHVDFCGVDAEDLFGDADDDGEGLVDFEERDVVDREVGLFEGFGEGDGGGDGEVDGLYTGVGVRWKMA